MKFYQILLLIFTVFFCFSADILQARRLSKWLCVYSHIPVKKLLATKAELMVLDPDAYSSKEVKAIRAAGIKVLAYLSVGEAEKYRRYFSQLQGTDLIIEENPDWSENFRVKFWKPLWKRILSDYSKEILNKGFDGLFVDIVDAWENFPESEINKRKEQMESLLIDLAKKMLSHDQGHWLMIQNSHELLENPCLEKLTTGINQESLFASWAEAEIDPEWQRNKILALEDLRRRGKLITLIEYTRNPIDMVRIRMRAAMHGFTPYFSVKELDRIFHD
jgi:cysteinyl-tRNA synthetase